jgi:acyl CoA:acetate/3-ketoacid CoA transferase alpha subunit
VLQFLYIGTKIAYKLVKEVMRMNQADLDTISEIVARYGLVEWTLIGFTKEREYNIFSYFTDPSIVPVFKFVLLSILKTIEEYLEKNEYEMTVHNVASC